MSTITLSKIITIKRRGLNDRAAPRLQSGLEAESIPLTKKTPQ